MRWTVDGREFHESFRDKTPAGYYLTDLETAYRKGEPFDTHTGLPASMARAKSTTTWLAHARDYTLLQWPRLSPNGRRSQAEGLTTVTMALLDRRRRGAPPDAECRRALMRFAFRPETAWTEQPPPDAVVALAWLETASLPVHVLSNPATVRSVLDACARKLDGTPSAASVITRKRAALSGACGYALERGLLTTPPLKSVRWRPPAVADAIDRRIVPTPQQVRDLLAALEQIGPWAERLQTFFATLYYAALRPSEAVALRENTCHLPDSGWGWLDLLGSEAKAGSAWTDTGRPRQARGLKHRPATETRRVPIPPILVTMLRDHLKRYGAGLDGRVFTNMRGNPLQDSGYGRALHLARAIAFTPDEAASPVARRAYDFRHGGITVWITNGLPITEAARRAGQGIDVLMRVYAGFLLIAYTTAENAISDAFDPDSAPGDASPIDRDPTTGPDTDPGPRSRHDRRDAA
ncbi:tyrosine-type recombinase/integrase [Cryptosporangium phraense]|uniref:tyrosine-type recombinase/integrase n=1 Tax=Cryptosporangium phraense TaxID=2593070 RepID=UPI00115BCED9|nr:hypothetical protein [Cryptosporangium phraense]